jgi:hypothetical protein
MLNELNDERRKKERAERRRITKAYKEDMAKAKATADKVLSDAKKALLRDEEVGKPRLDRLRSRERAHREEIDDLVKQLQREEERLVVSETDEKELETKLKQAKTVAMQAIWKDLEDEDPNLEKRSRKVYRSNTKVLHDETDPVAWMAKEQAYVNKAAKYAAKLWMREKEKIEKKYEHDVEDVVNWMKKGDADIEIDTSAH